MLCLIGNDDSDTADDPEINVDKIGTIQVQVFLVKVGKRSRSRSKNAETYEGNRFEELQAVSEKKLKGNALSHFAKQLLSIYKISRANFFSLVLDQANAIILVVIVTLGQPITSMAIFPSLLLSLGIVPEVSPPISQVILGKIGLSWCSEALKDMLIISRTPSPFPAPPPVARTPSPVTHEPPELPLDELSHEELLELARAQKVYSSFLCQVMKHITNSYVGRNNF